VSLMDVSVQVADRLALWDLLHSGLDRLFVQSPRPLGRGTAVDVVIRVASLDAAITLSSTVVDTLANGGAYVELPDDVGRKCADAFGAPTPKAEPNTRRRAGRLPCQVDDQDTVLLEHSAQEAVVQGVFGDVGDDVVFVDDDGRRICMQVRWVDEATDHTCLAVSPDEREVWAQTCDSCPAAARPRPVAVVADDDTATLRFLTRVLSAEGCLVLAVTSGNEALQEIRRWQPKLVLLDMLMPGLDGLNVCKVLRQDAAVSHAYVVLSSAVRGDMLGVVADEVGADAFLPKPTSVTLLRRHVRDAFSSS